jgi:hypothetical protein
MDAVFKLHDRVVGPKLLLNLSAADELSGTQQQHRENLKRLIRQLDAFSGFAQFARPQIDFE